MHSDEQGSHGPVERMSTALASALAAHDPPVDGQRAGRYRDLCVAAAEVLDMDGASVTLISSDGMPTLLAATNSAAEELSELQFTTGDGPIPRLLRDGTPVLTSQLDDAEWPLFSPPARQLNVSAIFVLPLQLGVIRLGVVSLHRGSPGPLTGPQRHAAAIFTRTTLETILSDLDQAPSVQSWLADVDGHEVALHHATGMVLVQLGVTAEEALLRLRAHAFGTGRPLGEVAADVVTRRLSFQEDDPRSSP